jgi:hypothetical protein
MKILEDRKPMELKNIKQLIANVYWDLTRDIEQMDTRDIYYEVGYMVSLCVAIGKRKIGQKIYDKFMLK